MADTPQSSESSITGQTSFDKFEKLFNDMSKLSLEMATLAGIQTVAGIPRKGLEMLENIESQSIRTTDVILELSGISRQALDDTSTVLTSHHRKFAESTAAETRLLHSENIDVAEGISHRVGLIYTDSEKFNRKFIDAISADMGLYASGLEDMTFDMKLNLNQATNAFNLSSKTLTEILKRDLAENGKITGETMLDFEKSVISAAQVSGLSFDQITSGVQKMIGNFANFGNLTIPQLASLTAQVGKLGLSIESTTATVGKFQSFDSAVTAVSNLAAATGVTLDTMELFELANTDQERFIVRLKEQLSDYGLVWDQMNFKEKQLVSQSLGLEPRALETLLNDQIKSAEGFKSAIETSAAAMSTDSTKRATNQLVDYSDAYKEMATNTAKVIENFAKLDIVSIESAKSMNVATNMIVSNAFATKIASIVSFEKQHGAALELLKAAKSMQAEAVASLSELEAGRIQAATVTPTSTAEAQKAQAQVASEKELKDLATKFGTIGGKYDIADQLQVARDLIAEYNAAEDSQKFKDILLELTNITGGNVKEDALIKYLSTSDQNITKAFKEIEKQYTKIATPVSSEVQVNANATGGASDVKTTPATQVVAKIATKQQQAEGHLKQAPIELALTLNMIVNGVTVAQAIDKVEFIDAAGKLAQIASVNVATV